MRLLCTVPCGMKHFTGDVSVVLWEKNDPFPELGPSVGVDTETELITDTVKDPPMVVLGVFDPWHSVCYVVYWYDVVPFMRELCRRNIEQRYFNLGFDEAVLDNEDEAKSLLLAIDSNRVFDMLIRQKLTDISKIGYTRKSRNTLKQCAWCYEKWELDKGDGTENSARLSFRRHNPDGSLYTITDEQAAYLPYDCIATWCLGEAMPMLGLDPRTGVPFELAHVKGMVALAHISINGFPVDMRVWETLERMLRDSMDAYRLELLAHGFPDPYKDDKREKREVIAMFHEQYNRMLKMFGLDSGFQPVAAQQDDDDDDDEDEQQAQVYPMPAKNALRRGIIYMWEHEPDEPKELAEDLKAVLEVTKPKNLRKAEDTVYDQICEDYGTASVDDASRALAMQGYIGALMKSICDDIEQTGSYDFRKAVDAADALIDEHPDWLAKTEAPSPKKFFQNHVRELLSMHPNLELEMTPKSKEYKLAKDDMWRLEDLGIEDKFLMSYVNFKHSQKLLKTYLNRKYICSDGKIRCHYTNILKTGRTSCSSPNAQNLPSREKHFPIKNAFTAPEGALMCATDYSFVELVCLAQSCYTRFGHSVLRDVINADVDPHYWFAGVRDGLITNDTSFIHSEQKIKELSQFLKENVSKEARQHAKMANFGFGGGMSFMTFWSNCRKQGVKMTQDDARRLREQWVAAFPEVSEHFNPEPAKQVKSALNNYGINRFDPDEESDPDEEVQDDPGDKRLFVAHLINGMTRNNGSYCSILNIQFQGLAAYGLKLGLWNMVMAGYLDRFLNEVHDEANYWLYPVELKVHVPIIEKCMINGMRTACPDVRVKVETSVMRHWDKNAIVFGDLEWDDNGLPIVDEPPFVQEVYGIKKPELTETK